MYKAFIKSWLDQNIWDGEDRSGSQDTVFFKPDNLQVLVEECVGAALASADSGKEQEPNLKALTAAYTDGYGRGHHDTVEGIYTHVYYSDRETYFEETAQDWIAEHPEYFAHPSPEQDSEVSDDT